MAVVPRDVAGIPVLAALTPETINSGAAPAAFADSFAQGFPRTMQFLLSKGACFEVAEEVAEVEWVRGWEVRHQLRSATRAMSWINAIAYRRLCSHHRQRQRLAILPDLEDERRPEPVNAVDAALLLDRCSPMELKLRYFAGMDLKEIAATQGSARWPFACASIAAGMNCALSPADEAI